MNNHKRDSMVRPLHEEDNHVSPMYGPYGDVLTKFPPFGLKPERENENSNSD